jgi:4-hydroxy-2-oxoheptanedioate aldolase
VLFAFDTPLRPVLELNRNPLSRRPAMQPNRVKKILREGGLALGTYVGGIAEPQIVEIIGHAGFDAAFIDLEHTSFDLRDVQLMVMAAERVGITPIVRTPGFDPAFILRLLDMGVQGIQVPHISDARAAREAVRAVRYAPLGDRGMAGASRASDYGVIPMREHLEQSNREITLAVMVEDLPALAEIDAIAATEGVDIVAVGPSDMSRALGVSGTPDHPKLVDVVHRVAEAVQKGGVARLALPMNHAALPRNAAQLRELGVGYTNCAPSPEVRILRSMQTQVAEARAGC